MKVDLRGSRSPDTISVHERDAAHVENGWPTRPAGSSILRHMKPIAVAAALCAVLLDAVSSAQTPPVSPAASSPVIAPAGQTHTAQIRAAHLTRIQERLAAAPGELKATCRFESEIGTLPPPGVVALTFDDGPEPGQTEHIVEVLGRLKVPATFFLIGEKAQRHADLLALMQTLPGVRIGNHSWSHPNFHRLDADVQRREIDESDERLAPLLMPASSSERLFRYPYGNSSCEGNERLHAKGYRIVGWHVDSCDWAFNAGGAVDVQEALSCGVLPAFRSDFLGHVLSSVRAHRGGILLMHETHRNTVSQLETLVRQLMAEGYSFGTPDEARFSGDLR